MFPLLTRIVERITSGRFILTVIGGVSFYYAVTHGVLDKATIASIIVMVFINYFQKDRPQQGGQQ